MITFQVHTEHHRLRAFFPPLLHPSSRKKKEKNYELKEIAKNIHDLFTRKKGGKSPKLHC
jgi:hypothetical protein